LQVLSQENEKMPKTITPPGRLLTCAQAGDALGLKEATIRVWIARRKLAFVKLGRAVRVPSEAIEEMIAANIVPARASK
jgi:excisionase family DNA binding protein